MILVTGAAGKTGRAVTRTLARKGKAVRALVRRAEQVESVQRAGAKEWVVGDMLDQESVDSACADAATVYHIPPNVSPEEVRIGKIIIRAAQKAGVARIVYHSVLFPQIEAMPHHWEKMRVEEQLIQSGLAFTILQPAAYMQNLLANWEEIYQKGIYRVPYPSDTRLGLVDLEDVAEAAATVLTEPGHENASYELAGPEALSQQEVADNLTEAIGRKVRAEEIPLEGWEQAAEKRGMGRFQIDTLLKMFRYYAAKGFWGSDYSLKSLLKREPRTLRQFLDRVIKEMK